MSGMYVSREAMILHSKSIALGQAKHLSLRSLVILTVDTLVPMPFRHTHACPQVSRYAQNSWTSCNSATIMIILCKSIAILMGCRTLN